jgi:Ca2+-binding RTX toxin-like protein
MVDLENQLHLAEQDGSECYSVCNDVVAKKNVVPHAKHHDHVVSPNVKHHEQAVSPDVKHSADIEKVIPEKEVNEAKESKQDSAPDATVNVTKETTPELDAKDGHTTDLSTIKIGNFSEVTSQERDLTTASLNDNNQPTFHLETTFIAPVFTLSIPQSDDSESSSSPPINIVTGTEGNDVLFGISGMINYFDGLAGDDIYYFTSPQDVAVGTLGNDTIVVDFSFTLPSNVENLTGIGTDQLVLTGNTGANIIVGNDANNIIDGRAGADTMVGGKGSDIYYVDNLGDVVVEKPGEGNDVIYTSISFTLPDNVESLVASNNLNIDLTGNSDNNVLLGGSGNNVLTGGLGADVFQFNFLAMGNDTVTDFVIGTDYLRFTGVPNMPGTTPGITIQDVIAAITDISHPNGGQDTQFTFSAGNSITLTGVNVATLQELNVTHIEVQP